MLEGEDTPSYFLVWLGFSIVMDYCYIVGYVLESNDDGLEDVSMIFFSAHPVWGTDDSWTFWGDTFYYVMGVVLCKL